MVSFQSWSASPEAAPILVRTYTDETPQPLVHRLPDKESDGGSVRSAQTWRSTSTLHDHFHLELNPTIYTTLLYAPAVARIKTGSCISKLSLVSLALVILNMVLQVGLLRVMDLYGQRDSQMSASAMTKHEDPHQSTEVMKKTYNAFLTPHEKEVINASSNRLDPACTRDKNWIYSCKPPSVRFAEDWSSLDINKDGVWTMSEAMDLSRKVVTKKEAENKLSPDTDRDSGDALGSWRTLLFNSIVHELKQRAAFVHQQNGTLYLNDDLLAGHAIAKPYFDYWAGDAMLCTRFESASCENIVASGLFDAALFKGHLAASHKGITSYASAARYCEMMLEDGGGCERSLPGYQKSKLDRRKMCGKVSLHGVGLVSNPHDATDVLPVMVPSYRHLSQHEGALKAIFLFFQTLILFVFFSSLVDEVRDLIKTGEFLLIFPAIEGEQDSGGIDHGSSCIGHEKRFVVERISFGHRAGMFIVYILRVAIIVLMIKFGTWFLLTEDRYVELVLNALALSFITGIDEILYDTFLESYEKDSPDGFGDVDPVKYESKIPLYNTWEGVPFTKKFWGLVLIPCASVSLVLGYAYFEGRPVVEALTCACLQEGEHCSESMARQKAWWQHYWVQTLPAAIHQIEALRLQPPWS